MANTYYIVQQGVKVLFKLDARDYTLAAAIKEAEKDKATKIVQHTEGSISALRVVWRAPVVGQ